MIAHPTNNIKMSEATHNSSTAPPPLPTITTETFQKHYGRGSAANAGYPKPPHPPHHLPMDSNYQQPHFAPPPNEPPSRGAPHHGYAHAPSWYYHEHHRQHHGASPPPQHQFPSPQNHHDTSTSAKRNSAPPPQSQMSHPLVTPKESNDSSDSAPHLPTSQTTAMKKKPARPMKHQSYKNNTVTSSSSSAKEAAAGEIQVEPMKQDFYIYANDRFDAVKAQCEEECKSQLSSSAGGGGKINNKENELYRLTTLMNARLIQDWESGPATLRAEYMKMEDADRQRFMSEEEVASRHCATLTARKRSPKQQNDAAYCKRSTTSVTDGMVVDS